MANANWSNPTLTSTYTNFVSEVKNRDEDLALQFDGTTSTNIPTNTIRWDSAANRWKKWNGSSWAELTSTYALTGLSTTGNASIGGTLGVTGATTLSSLTVSGATTFSGTVSGTALIPTAATVPVNGVFLPAANTVGVATNSTERLRVTSAGTTLLGTQTALANAYAIGTALTPSLQIESNTANGAALSITRQTSAAANLLLQRGVTGTPVVDTDAVGQIGFNGFDGTNYFNAALIRGVVDGTPGTGSMPGRLSFQTTPTGSTTPVERLRLDPAGQILAASLGTAALPVWSFTGDPNTGIYSPGADQVAVSTNGTQRFTVSTTAVTSTLPVVAPLGAAATPSITFSGDLNTGILSPGADTVGVSTAGTERFRVASDGSMSAVIPGGSTLYPASTCRAWVNFNGIGNTNLSGTYSQSGTTVTVTATAHGLIAGSVVYSDITSGTAVDGTYTVATVTSANVFTYTAGTSLTTSGNITLIRSTIRASFNVSSVTDAGVGSYRVNFTTAMPDANYAAVVSTTESSTRVNEPVAPTTTTLSIQLQSPSDTQVDGLYVSAAVFR